MLPRACSSVAARSGRSLGALVAAICRAARGASLGAVCSLLVLAPCRAADPSPPSPLGTWLTADGTGVVRIEACGTRLCASIAGIGRVARGEAPPRDYHGDSECGLTIMYDLTETKPGFWQGHILDPDTGGLYNARVWLDVEGRLHLRGYLGISLLGETQIWTRYRGSLAGNCSFSTRAGLP